MQSEPKFSFGRKARGRRIGALAALGCLVGAIGCAGLALLTRQAAEPSGQGERAALDAAIARIDAESRDDLAAAVASPEFPAEAKAEVEASGNASTDAAPQAPTLEPPEGYSFVRVETEMAKAPMPERGLGESEDAADGLDWLGAPDAIPALARQAEAAGRDWSFGWVRAAHEVRPEAAEAALEDAGLEVLGASGRLLRVKLPGDPASLLAISALPEVAGLGALPKERKVAAAFVEQAIAAPAHERTPVFITLMTDDPQGRWRRRLEALGAVVGRFDPDLRAYAAHIAHQALDAIASQDFVLAVEPIGIVRAAHDTAVPAMGADALRRYEGSSGLFSGIGGASAPIAVMDTGLNINHLDIATNRESICGANFVYFSPRVDEADLWLDDHGHGTHVTGTIAGNGYVEPRYVGMAPSVRHIRFAKVLSHLGFGNSDSILRGMDFLARPSSCAEAGWSSARVKPLIVNMSLSANSRVFEGRGFEARKLDAIVWRHRQLYVVAQSNASIHGFSNYASAKNSLAVGAAHDSGDIVGFSSHGPTADGRLAPQVVATGVDIYSAQGGGSRGHYKKASGTSMAAPSVAGVAALLMDSVQAHRERPALTRARLMASAIKPDVWLDGPSRFPANNSNGPGARQAQYGLGKVSARTSALDRNRADGWVSGGAVSDLQDGEYAYRDIEVPANASRLDLAMTWDEPPTDTIDQAVLNDLDLWLDRDGDCGSAACGEQSSTSRKDNVEWIILRNPSPGTYRAKILPRRIHGTAPRAALAWTLIRGPATPQLRIQADKSSLNGAGPHDLRLTLTADGYVAAGTQLHVACDAQDLSACSNVRMSNFSRVREDGIADAPADISWGTSVELGEIASGEPQEVSLQVANSGQASVRLYFKASAWNAQAALASVGLSGSGGASPPAIAERPANDGFAAAALLEGNNGVLALDLRLATSEPGEPAFSAGGSRPAGALWHLWTAPADGLARFGVQHAETSGGNDPSTVRIDVYQGDHIARLEPVASKLWGASFFADQGETYRIRVSHAGSGSPLALHWSQGPRPANDDFSQAIALNDAEGTAEGSNQGATLEPGEQFGPLAATVWHRWQAPTDGIWRFAADGSAKVLVFTGSAVAALRLVSGYPGRSAIFPARAGETYQIAIAAADAFTGGRRYRLTWREHSRAGGNDDFADAAEISGESSSISISSNAASTVEPSEPAETGVRTRWWTWTAPADGRYAWRLVDTTYRGLQVTAFASSLGGEDANLENLQLLGATGSGAASTEFAFDAVADRRYWFAAGYAMSDLAAFQQSRAYETLAWAPTPENDELADAALLSGASGDVGGSNAFATTERGERAGREGHSSLWWAWEAPAAGWYRFWVDGDAAPFTLAAYQGEGDGFGGLGLIVSSYIGWPGASDGLAEVLFHAEPGVRYWVRLGSPTEASAGKFSLKWDEAAPPTWLKYAGRLGRAQLGFEQWNVVLGGLAFDDLGATLYMQSDLGLHVLERDAATGALKPIRIIENSLAASSALIWDSRRTKLYAQGCETWRRFAPVGENRRELSSDDLPAPEGFSGACAEKMFMDPTSEFLFLVSNAGVDTFVFDSSDGLQHVNHQNSAGLQDAVISRGGGNVHVATNSQLKHYGRDAETGGLSLISETWSSTSMRTLAVSDDDRYLFTFSHNGDATVFPLDAGLANAQRWKTLPKFGNARWSDQDGRCSFSAIRRDRPAADAFCRNSAFSIAYRPPAADAQELGELTGSDYIANWQPDRFNNLVPNFRPRKAIASPDGKHFYVATYEGEILHFERIGNRIVDAAVPGDEPDLAVGVPRADSGSLAPGASFSLRAVVRNQGGVDASATTVRWRRSSDAAIDAEDEQVGLSSLEALAASVSGEKTISLTAPSNVGIHYYGACADALADESRTGNNCSAGALFRVGASDDGGSGDGGGGNDDDHGNSPETATDLSIPSSTAGRLERPGDRDYFRILLQQAAAIDLQTTGETDTYGTLRRQDGSLIAENDDGGNGWNFRINRSLAAGTYFLEVRGFSSSTTGGYALEAAFSDGG